MKAVLVMFCLVCEEMVAVDEFAPLLAALLLEEDEVGVGMQA